MTHSMEHHVNTAHVATGVSYTAAGTTIIGGLAMNEWLAMGGFALAFLTFVINWVYKHRIYKAVKNGDLHNYFDS